MTLGVTVTGFVTLKGIMPGVNHTPNYGCDLMQLESGSYVTLFDTPPGLMNSAGLVTVKGFWYTMPGGLLGTPPCSANGFWVVSWTPS